MSNSVSALNYYFQNEVRFSELSKSNKLILIALATIMGLGMIFSYSLGAPWYLTVVFFVLTLAPLFPVGKTYLVSPNKVDI